MTNYDFQILQPNEFECLTRDLLQKKEKIFVESFTPGRDGGIDLRFAKVKGANAIVQAKRYKDFASLKRVLIKEVEKVRSLNPYRYILSTSVGLTPGNKEDIKSLFAPYILSTEDILGRDDLNNLLGQYNEIEKQYYKLWLGSVAILEDILNKRINSWSSIEMEKIQREVSTYVMNSSFDKALDILTNNRYVVISGIPGIGKTTLARMLVNYLLSQGYEELVKLESVGDAAQKITAGKKQIFFFDDFLGSTFFQNDEKGFDQKLIAFIDKVKHEPDKVFILSTREYILAEAKQTYDILSTSNIELAKCVLDLSDYSESIRAKILYNHLAAAELPIPYVKALLHGRGYLQIIKHGNFNPRIIETFLNSNLYQKVDPDRFVAKFIDFFDRPFAVWELAFRQLKPVAQYALLVRLSMGDRTVLLSDWYDAVKTFIKGTENDIHLIVNDIIWHDIIKIIEGTFIITKRKGNDYLADYQNPSVFDFLLEWLKDMHDVQELLIKESLFAEQLYKTFSNKDNPCFADFGRIKVQESAFPTIETAFKRHLTGLRFCTLSYWGTPVIRKPQNIVDFLLDFERSFEGIYKSIPELVAGYVTQDVLEDTSVSLMKRLSLLDKLSEETKEKLDMERLAENVLKESDSLDDYVNVLDLLSVTEIGKEALDSESLLDKIEEVIEKELMKADTEEDCASIGESVAMLSNYIPALDEDIWQKAIEEVKSGITQGPDYNDDFSHDFSTAHNDSNDQYEEMFSSLLELGEN